MSDLLYDKYKEALVLLEKVRPLVVVHVNSSMDIAMSLPGNEHAQSVARTMQESLDEIDEAIENRWTT